MFLVLLVLAVPAVQSSADGMEPDHEEKSSIAYTVSGDPEMIIADTSEIYAEITNLTMSEINNAFEAEIYFCNKTDGPVDVELGYAAVNGYVMDAYMFDVIPAQHRTILYLEVLAEDIEQACMQSVDCLTFRFTVEEDAMENPKELFCRDVTVYPTGLSPEEIQIKELKDFPTPDYPFAQLSYENEFIDFRVLDAKRTDNSAFYQITAIAENKCGRDILLSGSNFVVDGVVTDPYWYCRIPAGLKAVTDIWIDAESLAMKGVTEFDTVSFSLALYESMDYDQAEYSSPFFAYPLSFNPAKG